MLRALLLPLALLLTGCVPVPRVAAPPPAAAAFPVIAFFTGPTEGEGILRVATRDERRIWVTSMGRVEGGELRVEQLVREEGKPPRQREWRIREIAPGRFAGSLSDAAGPVTGVAMPGRLTLRFPMRGAMQAEQQITLSGDGRSARNILTVRRFGLTLAVLDETIRRRD